MRRTLTTYHYVIRKVKVCKVRNNYEINFKYYSYVCTDTVFNYTDMSNENSGFLQIVQAYEGHSDQKATYH